jgi:hypothetical protein
MTFGVQIADTAGSVIWDSTTVVGGMIADFRSYASGAAGETISYPQWAGYTAFLIVSGSATATTISLATSAGYPVVTVISGGYQTFALGVY